MQRCTTIWEKQMARTRTRSGEDLVLFIFKLNQLSHSFVKLNHFFSYISSPMDSVVGNEKRSP